MTRQGRSHTEVDKVVRGPAVAAATSVFKGSGFVQGPVVEITTMQATVCVQWWQLRVFTVGQKNFSTNLGPTRETCELSDNREINRRKNYYPRMWEYPLERVAPGTAKGKCLYIDLIVKGKGPLGHQL